MAFSFFKDLFPGEPFFMFRSFQEVAEAIRQRHPELEETIAHLEEQLEAERKKLASTGSRAAAHAALDRIFDLRSELGRYSNNPANQTEKPESSS